MILVTGGTGLLGGHLLYSLSVKKFRIRALYRSEDSKNQIKKIFSCYTGDPDEYFSRIDWIKADILDEMSLQAAFIGVSKVYHTAAMLSFNPSDRNRLLENNIRGTSNIINLCLEHKIRKLCYVSSTAALGSSSPGVRITEDCIWTAGKSRSAYPVSKFKAEMEVWRGMAEGLDVVIVNPSIIIGPGNWNRSSSALFMRIWKGMKYYTEGITGYVDVRDVVDVMIRLMEGAYSGERFIVSAENLSYHHVFSTIARALGKKPPAIQAGRQLIEIAWRLDWLMSKLFRRERQLFREAVQAGCREIFFSNDKVRASTGIRFRNMDRSIQETAEFFLREISTPAAY